MYVPLLFKEDRIDVLHAAIRRTGLATLVTLTADGLIASHVPMLLDAGPAPYGTLLGHIARPNPQARGATPGVQALAIFQGPEAYITPSWYATKRKDGKVVPTWNYVAVHAYGPALAIHDHAWLMALVERLTARHEAGRASPWKVSDAPADYVARRIDAIVGIEIPIVRIEGKWKVSQNQPQADMQGIVAGLSGEARPDAVEMARLVEEHAGLRKA